MGDLPRLGEPVQNFVICMASLAVTVCLVTALASMMFKK